MDQYKQIIKTYNQLGKKYLKNINKVVIPELLDFAIALPPKGHVLDVGCAGGRDSKVFSSKGFKVTGIDGTKIFIDEAKKYVPKAKFKKMDVRKMTFAKNFFDGIWANAVLLHFDKKDLPKIFKKFYQILKPSGLIHVRVKKRERIKNS